MKNIFQWTIIALIIIGYFIFVYRINNKENIIKREPKSIFKQEEETLQATITQYPTLTTSRSYTSTNNQASFSINYPDNWSINTETINNETIITIEPLNNTSNECVKIYQSEDTMPLLEAVNYSKHMQKQKNMPYTLKEPIETSIDGMPAHMSKLIPDSKKPDTFMRNVVVVQDNTYTTIIRGCAGTPDAIFFPVLNSISFL